MLCCKSAEMFDKEIAVHLLAYNLVRANLARAANAYDKIPRQLSFRTRVQLMNGAVGLFLTRTEKAVEKWLSVLLCAIAHNKIGTRKLTNQSRVIKRRTKAYPLMVKPRADYIAA